MGKHASTFEKKLPCRRSLSTLLRTRDTHFLSARTDCHLTKQVWTYFFALRRYFRAELSFDPPTYPPAHPPIPAPHQSPTNTPKIVNFVGVQCEVKEEAHEAFRERLRKIPLPEELMRDDNDDAPHDMA